MQEHSSQVSTIIQVGGEAQKMVHQEWLRGFSAPHGTLFSPLTPNTTGLPLKSSIFKEIVTVAAQAVPGFTPLTSSCFPPPGAGKDPFG